MKNVFIAGMILMTLNASCQNKKQMDKKSDMTVQTQPSSIHSFQVKALDGSTLNLADYKGKKILIVNTASECGYTSQYKKLQELHEQFGSKVAVIGFPCNDFGGQEPGSESEIRSFCSREFNVSFPMAAKVRIKGDNADPIYQWLTRKEKNGVMDSKVSWNFNKFLLDENGILLEHFSSGVSPLDDEILSRIK